MGTRPLAIALLAACSSPSPGGPAPRAPQVEIPDAGVAAQAPVDAAPADPDATAVTSLDVLRSTAATGTTFYWRVPTDPVSCQGWSFEPDDDGGDTGRLLRNGLSFRYEIGTDLRVSGSYFGDQRSTPSCDDHLRPTMDDSTVLAFDTGVWYWDEATCERDTRMMPPGCAALVTTTSAATTKPGDVLAKVIKKRGAVYLPWQRDDGYVCRRYKFGKTTLEDRDEDGATGWTYEYADGKLTLAGSYAEDASGESGMAIGDFEELFVHPMTGSIVLVGGYPWFLDEAACERALRLTGSR